MINKQNFSTSFIVNSSAEEVFKAINNTRAWWSGEIEGETDKIGSEFTYSYKDVHKSVQKVVELVPNKKIVWHVQDAQLNFVKDKDEWKGTEIIFEISEVNGKTELKFTHKGLIQEFECYDACSNAWSQLINQNLKNLIITGENQPSVFE